MHPRALAPCLILSTPLIAIAAETPSGESPVYQIVVTAQKRETALQDVPFSVAASSEEQIRNAGATNVVEFARNIPGLAITDLGPGQSQVAIRGISAGQVVRDQPGVKESVGVYLDESAISVALFTPDLDLFDLQRVEVLRGPQGTLFGAGSSSGTIRYITQQPEIGRFEGVAETSAYTGTSTDVGGSLKGAVNLPIGDTTAARFVGYYNELAGFIDSYYPGRSVQEDVNSGERYGARASLRFQPSESLSITPRIVFQKLETDGFPRADVYSILGNPYTTTEPPVSPSDRGQVTQLREGIEDDFLLADLNIQVGFGDVTFSSITSYTDRDVVVVRDASPLSGSVTYGSLGGDSAAVRLDSPLIDATDLQAFSQEIRLSSGQARSFEWVVGAFYQEIDRDYGQTLPTPGFDAFLISAGLPPSSGFNAPPDNPYYSSVPYEFSQMALFGEGTFHFTEQWSLTTGLRYYDFDEDRLLTFAGIFADQGYTDEPGSTSSDGFSPRVILAYQPDPDLMFTAQVARGFRLGGINDPLNVTLCTPEDLVTFGGQPTFDDEKVLNFEVGMKSTFADGRVTFNAAIFRSDIEDLQVIADAGSCSSRIVLNAEAESVGAEFELFARPSENWDFGLSATYAQAEITQSRLTGSGAPIAGIRDGNRLPTSPEFQAAATVTYSWQLASARDAFANFTFQHVGSSYTQLADQEPPFGCVGCPGAPGFFDFGDPTISQFQFETELPDYQIGNLRAGLRTDTWEAAVFVNNVWDERALLSLDRERGTRARVGYYTNTPRTYGVSLRVGF